MKAWRLGNQKIAARISKIQRDKFLSPEAKETAIEKLRTQRMSKRQARQAFEIPAQPTKLVLQLMSRSGFASKEVADEVEIATESAEDLKD